MFPSVALEQTGNCKTRSNTKYLGFKRFYFIFQTSFSRNITLSCPDTYLECFEVNQICRKEKVFVVRIVLVGHIKL